MPPASSKKLLKDIPGYDDMWTTVHNLEANGEAAAAVMGAAYLDHVTERLLSARFIELSKDDLSRLFSPSNNGILSAFAAKVRIAYALELIGPDFYHDLKLIGDIRNVFAHSLHPVGFDNPLISEDCYRLRTAAPTFAPGESQKSDTAFARYLEAVFVIYAYARINEAKLINNRARPQESRPEPLYIDPFPVARA